MHFLKIVSIALLLGTIIPGLSQENKSGLSLLPSDEYAALPQAKQFILGNIPRSTTLAEYFPIPRNQGEMLSCSAFAASYIKSYRIYEFYGKRKTAEQLVQSPAYSYSSLTNSTCKNGLYIRDTLNFMKDNGSVDWDDLPYDGKKCPDWHKVAPKARYNSTVSFALPTGATEALKRIHDSIANGTPVILSLDDCELRNLPVCFSEKEISRACTIQYNAKFNQCHPHSLLVVGYDDDRSALHVINSWGLRWADKGKAWISYDLFRRRYNGEAYVDFGPGKVTGQNFPVLEEKNSSPDISPGSESRTSDDLDAEDLVHALRTNIAPYTGQQAEILGRVKPVSEWSIWLNLPDEIAKNIIKVEYYFLAPSFINPKRSQPNSSIFLSTWTGHGCTHNAKVIAHLKNKTTVEAPFDYCAVLSRSQPSLNKLFNNFLPQYNVPEEFKKFAKLFFSSGGVRDSKLHDEVIVKKIGRENGKIFLREKDQISSVEEVMSSQIASDDIALGYGATISGSIIVCVFGTPVGYECPNFGTAFEFIRGNKDWRLIATYRTAKKLKISR